MRKALETWSLKQVVESLMGLRGVKRVTAMSVTAELGDISRFDSPRQLMAYLGLVPSEESSGGKQIRGGITKTGNGRVRRLLVEAAWCYRFPARRSLHLQKKAEKATEEAKAIAWKAQKRLCHRYQVLLRDRKKTARSRLCDQGTRSPVGESSQFPKRLLYWRTLDNRPRQLRDEGMSGVNQHAYIRLIHRRFELLVP